MGGYPAIQEKELEYKGSTTYKDSFTFISQICNKDIFKDIDQYFFTCNLLPITVEQHFNQYNEQDFTNKSIINAVQSFYQEDEFLKELEQQEKTLESNNTNDNIRKEQLKEINRILSDETVDLFEPQTMRALLDCIKVVNKNTIEFQFKCDLIIQEYL